MNRRAVLTLQYVSLVSERTGKSLSTQLQRQRPLVQPSTMSMQTWILRGYYNDRRWLSSPLSGERERERERISVLYIFESFFLSILDYHPYSKSFKEFFRK